jgi:5-methylcytosine-specific restriction endonuclease McrA
MFDIKEPDQALESAALADLVPDSDLAAKPILPGLEPSASPPPSPVPLERLEAQLCEVAGHLAAATCRFLVLLGEFDERRGWASWEMNSCAAWLSWKCQMSSGTAREHVRVARALRELPVIRAEFAAARLSYVKVRALTRIATPATEADLAELAGPMTGNQLERFARAHRQCSRADDAAARVRRRLTWRFEEDGSLAGNFRLPPLPGAVLLKALRAAIDRPEQPGEDGDGPAGVSAETPAARKPDLTTSSDLADALAVVAESFLAGKVAGADDAEVYQVVVHVGTDAIGVSAETPPPAPGDPADPARCHVEDGAALSVTTAQMIGCSAALSWLLHGAGGRVLDLGRRRRRPNAALRKAARERDHGRCRYPGCESRKVDLHHIQYWSNGGRTSLDNLVSLCKRHHMAVHDRGCLIAARPGGTVAFYAPDGTPVPASPALPSPDGGIADVHDAEITPETIIPPWHGERLDLDYAIYTCLANAGARQVAQADPDGPDSDTARRGAAVFAPGNWYPLIRQYNDETFPTSGPRVSFPDWLDQRPPGGPRANPVPV